MTTPATQTRIAPLLSALIACTAFLSVASLPGQMDPALVRAERGRTAKATYHFPSPDKFVYCDFDVAPDGKEYTSVEVTYVRNKSQP